MINSNWRLVIRLYPTKPLINQWNIATERVPYLAKRSVMCYILIMIAVLEDDLSSELASELENKFFWWEPVGSQPRSSARILAQAMNFASFKDVLRLEREVGSYRLVQVMLSAEPGWINDRSWEFWRGRLALSTGRAIPEEPPRRSFNATMF